MREDSSPHSNTSPENSIQLGPENLSLRHNVSMESMNSLSASSAHSQLCSQSNLNYVSFPKLPLMEGLPSHATTQDFHTSPPVQSKEQEHLPEMPPLIPISQISMPHSEQVAAQKFSGRIDSSKMSPSTRCPDYSSRVKESGDTSPSKTLMTPNSLPSEASVRVEAVVSPVSVSDDKRLSCTTSQPSVRQTQHSPSK